MSKEKSKKSRRTIELPASCVTDRFLLRGAEVAEIMGCSRAMAYRLMQKGVIPIVRVPGGKTVRVPREALLQWIKNNTQTAGVPA